MWEELSDKARQARFKALNTVKTKEGKADDQEAYWTSKSGNTDVFKRGNLLAKKPSQARGSKGERTRPKVRPGTKKDTVQWANSDLE